MRFLLFSIKSDSDTEITSAISFIVNTKEIRGLYYKLRTDNIISEESGVIIS